ncbi:hypothetical protein, partial [Streptococcus pneumoniae]
MDVPIADAMNRGAGTTVCPKTQEDLPMSVELLGTIPELEAAKRIYCGIRVSWGLDGVCIDDQS